MTGDRGQASVALVGIVLLLVAAGALFAHLMRVADAGSTAQRAADLAALAAARRLAHEPFAKPAHLRAVAGSVAAANGARLTGFTVLSRAGLPAGVEVRVTTAASGRVPGAGQRSDVVSAVSRAGVSFSAVLPANEFRPVDLAGLGGRGALVQAAAAQVGWPYVWGGESRAEGGFDCSGLIGFAYAAAGHPLPGRPTAASLWQAATPLTPAELLPGDLVFLGAGSGAPHHVGMYAGGGAVVVAPHTGGQVRFEPLAAGGWDGFGRIIDLPGDPEPPALAVARAAGVPPDVVDAELRLGLTADPAAAARALAAALARHPGDLASALTDQLGDRSAAALVLRLASGPALGVGGEVRLLPRPAAQAASGAPSGPLLPTVVQAPTAGPQGPGWGGRAGALLHGAEAISAQLAERSGRVTLQALAGVRNAARFSLTGLSLLLPDRWQDVPALAGAAWDTVSGTAEAVTLWGAGGAELSGFGLLAARFNVVGGALSTGLFGYQAVTARTRRDRLGYGLLAVGSGLATAGTLTAGAGLLPFVAVGAVAIPPVGLALIAAGATLCVAGYLVRHPAWCRAAVDAGGRLLDAAWRVETAPVRAAASVAGRTRDAASSVIDAIPTPW